jgi:hypothetical protein
MRHGSLGRKPADLLQIDPNDCPCTNHTTDSQRMGRCIVWSRRLGRNLTGISWRDIALLGRIVSDSCGISVEALFTCGLRYLSCSRPGAPPT